MLQVSSPVNFSFISYTAKHGKLKRSTRCCGLNRTVEYERIAHRYYLSQDLQIIDIVPIGVWAVELKARSYVYVRHLRPGWIYSSFQDGNVDQCRREFIIL